MPPSSCAVGESDLRVSSNRGPRYLVYAPQFGLSNQLVALRNAVAWAQLLNRTLVLPHLLAHGTVFPRAPFGLAFDAASARSALDPLAVIEMDSFLDLGLEPAGVVALTTSNKFRPADDNAYFDSLGVHWHRDANNAPLVHSVPMAQMLNGDSAFSPAAILSKFADCARGHQVLAFRSLFAAFDPKPLAPSPPGWSVCPSGGPSGGAIAAASGSGCQPGVHWLDRVALPALLTPSLALESVADSIAAQLRAADATLAPHGRAIGCAHIRRGDFTDECVAYDIERSRPHPRPWVVSHHRNGWGCLQSESELALNLQAAERAQAAAGLPPLSFYASVEDASVLGKMASLRRFNLSSLATFEPLLRQALLPLPPTLAAILIDQLTCARASVLLLNAYSTFSQLVMGRMGLRRPKQLGWVRDLTKRQQAQLGVKVSFWRREDSGRMGRLV